VTKLYTGIKGLRARIDAEGRTRLAEESSTPSVKAFAENHGFQPQQVYSWRSRDIAVPVRLLEATSVEPNHIVSLKGAGRSLEVRKPELPFNPSNELLTRLHESVHRDRSAAPMYMTDDRGNLKRFRELLAELGDVETTAYDREARYQLRYPKFLDRILRDREFKPVFSALVDENGSVGERYLRAKGKTVRIDEFEGKLSFNAEQVQTRSGKGRRTVGEDRIESCQRVGSRRPYWSVFSLSASLSTASARDSRQGDGVLDGLLAG
jgi:hypothetical protein